jgi:hypothetical protein
VKLIPGASRKRTQSPKEGEKLDIVYAKQARPLQSLMLKQQPWFNAIDQAIAQITKAMSAKANRTPARQGTSAFPTSGVDLAIAGGP